MRRPGISRISKYLVVGGILRKPFNVSSYLVDLQIDTLLVGGQSTSGCVRATVLDAFSYGFRTIVVEECTFDRATVSHKVNLFDMHQKYADVTPLGEVLDYLRRLACSGSPASS